MTNTLKNYRHVTESERDALSQEEFDQFHDEIMRRMQAIKVCIEMNTPDRMVAAIDISITLPRYLMLPLWQSWSGQIMEILKVKEA